MIKEEKGLISWFTGNPVAANLLMALIIIAGLLTAVDIRKESFPDLTAKAVNVSVTYPGATPTHVEDGVLLKIESALKGLEGVKRITATAYEGGGSVRIEASNHTDMTKFKEEIRSRVDGVAGFPADAETPEISEEVMKTQVLWVALSGDMGAGGMKKLAERIKDRLAEEMGISQVEIEGIREPEITIAVDEETLIAYGLSLETVAGAVRNATVELSAGTLRTDGGEIRIATGEKPLTADDFRRIPVITQRGGARVLVSDLATVTDGFAEGEEFLRVNGTTAVGLQIFRTGEQSTLDVARDVRAFVDGIRPDLQDSVNIHILADTSVMLKSRIDLMLRNITMGTALVFLSLALFLRVRIAFWVMAGIPVCFLGTLWLMPMSGATVNMVTLYGFILVLGIMVDDAIVVGESVHAEISENGPGPLSAVRGTRRVAVPVTCGVLTTVAAFLPMLGIPGVNGKLWAGIAWVVILALLFSLLESKLILPAHLARIRPEKEGPKTFFSRLQDIVDRTLADFLQRCFRPLIRLSLEYRYITFSLFIAVMVIAAGCLKGGIVRVVFFPQVESDILEAEMEMAAGTPRKAFLAAAAKIEAAAKEVNRAFLGENRADSPPIKAVLSYTTDTRKVGYFVELSPNETRRLTAEEIMGRWRKAVGTIPGVTRLSFSAGFDDQGSPIHFRLTGADYRKLAAAGEEVREALKGYAGVTDIRDSVSSGKPEIRLLLKPGAEALGITRMDLARQIRQGFYGAEVMKLQRGRDEIKVQVRYPESRRRSLADLTAMRVHLPDGRALPFSAVTSVRMTRTPAEIIRVNGKREISIEAGVEKGRISPAEVISEMEKKVLPKILARYPGIRYAMGGEAEEQALTLGSMQKNALLALLLIYALMAVPLKSYVQPLLIMAAIPFGVVGAILGHLLFGLPLSILSMLGIIALSGVVVNDSLVLVEGVNREREKGLSLDRALEEACARRFRPILLTSVTTFLGLVPMVMERSLQAQFLIPMAVALAFGILFATGITLILIPTLYRIGGDAAALFRGGKGGRFSLPASAREASSNG